MKASNLTLLAVLGVGGYIAYSLYQKSQGSGYTPSTRLPSGGGTASGGSSNEWTFERVMSIANKLFTAWGDIKLTYDQKIGAVRELKSLVDKGTNQQQIYITMKNKYNLSTAQVDSMINEIYA